jgi:hypothetical protein
MESIADGELSCFGKKCKIFLIPEIFQKRENILFIR